MGLLETAFRWRDERLAIVDLRRQQDQVEASYEPLIEVARHKSRDEWAYVLGERQHEMLTIISQVEQIETRRRLRAAYRYGVPVPDKPSMDGVSEYWDWYSVLGDHFLSTKGHAYLRREIAMERDLYYKPWLSWLAIIFSFAGLIISASTALLR